MSNNRRVFTDKFKAKVALDAIRSLKTLGELATEYKVHPNQISQWKRELLTHAPELFSGKKSTGFKTEEALTAPLYEEIGRLNGCEMAQKKL